MRIKPVAKAKAKAKRSAYKPRKYFTEAEMLAHVQGYMGTVHWTIKPLRITRETFGNIEHVILYYHCIPKFNTPVPRTVHYQMYDNGTPKAGGRLGT